MRARAAEHVKTNCGERAGDREAKADPQRNAGAGAGITTVHEASAAEETKWLTGKGTGISLTDAGVYYPDPLELIEERLGPNEIYPLGAGANVANYRNPEFDKLLSEAGESLDKHERLQMIGDLLRIVANEVPDWPLYSPGLFATLSDKYVLPGFSYWTQLFSPWALHVKLTS